MDNDLNKFKQTLKTAKTSATKARLSVFTALKSGPKSLNQLVSTTRSSADRATVYRTIELFERLGIVNSLWHGHQHQVELSEVFIPHHHHAICQNCGQTVDLSASELEIALGNLAKKHHFLALNHTVELSGYCSNCQN